MSSVYFHTPNDTARLHGSERAYFAQLCQGLTWSIFDYYAEWDMDKLLILFPASHYVHKMSTPEAVRTAFFATMFTELKIGDRAIDSFALSLNTALALGSDAVKLAARIHGECELHCWVSGANRQWLAGIIQQGLDCRLYRQAQGWDDVMALLVADSDSPAVLSYSGCERFPNSTVANWTSPDDDDEAWYELPKDEQWRLAFEGLSANEWLEMAPDRWTDYCFADGYTAMDLVADLNENKKATTAPTFADSTLKAKAALDKLERKADR